MEIPGTQKFRHERPFRFDSGGELPGFVLAYETWGTLNEARDNAVLLHTGLSASSHARSHEDNREPGWWEEFVGPGLALDTDRFFVICTNVLGGCFGTTGPASKDPDGRPWAMRFPILSVGDMVRAQLLLLDHLGIERLHASLGSSLGGMQSLALAAEAPDRVARVGSFSAAARCYPLAIAMRFAQRTAVMSDPNWKNGDYYDGLPPCTGLKIARQMGTISYRSGPEWDERFGRARKEGPPTFGVDFEVESYLDHQGSKFCQEYDANSYLYVSKAMDLFDVTDSVHRFTGPTLVIGVTSDLLFPVWQQREVAHVMEQAGADVTYLELDAAHGHDTFLVLVDEVGDPVKRFLEA
jgi:homoserine O-acetyltransferase